MIPPLKIEAFIEMNETNQIRKPWGKQYRSEVSFDRKRQLRREGLSGYAAHVGKEVDRQPGERMVNVMKYWSVLTVGVLDLDNDDDWNEMEEKKKRV